MGRGSEIYSHCCIIVNRIFNGLLLIILVIFSCKKNNTHNIAYNNMEKEKVFNKNSHLITACLDGEFRCISYSLYLNYE